MALHLSHLQIAQPSKSYLHRSLIILLASFCRILKTVSSSTKFWPSVKTSLNVLSVLNKCRWATFKRSRWVYSQVLQSLKWHSLIFNFVQTANFKFWKTPVQIATFVLASSKQKIIALTTAFSELTTALANCKMKSCHRTWRQIMKLCSSWWACTQSHLCSQCRVFTLEPSLVLNPKLPLVLNPKLPRLREKQTNSFHLCNTCPLCPSRSHPKQSSISNRRETIGGRTSRKWINLG